MAIKIKDNIINVFGDNLQSCLYARYLATLNPTIQIFHYSYGHLGGIYNGVDGILGALSQSQINMILKYIEFEFTEISEIFVKVPYGKISFMNTLDGNIRFPFNKKSFESEYDYNDMIQSTPTYTEFMNSYKSSKNLVKTLRAIYSDSFYMEIAKKIGTNYYNVTQSQLDPSYIYKELLEIGELATNINICKYFPTKGYEELCNELLNCYNITKIHEPRKDIKHKIRSNNEMNYIFEYYDYYLDFIFGPIEYVKESPNFTKISLYDPNEISITLSPYDKKYGKYYKIDSKIYGISTSKHTIDSNTFIQASPLPTANNMKKIAEYNQLTTNIPNIRLCR